MGSKFLLLVLLLCSISSLILPASAQSYNGPDKIDLDIKTTQGFSGWKGTTKGTLRNHGISVITEQQISGFHPKLLHLTRINFAEIFSDIDFIGISGWQLFQNNSIEVYDVSSYRINFTVYFSDIDPIQLSYTGHLIENSLNCNVKDACDFVTRVISISEAITDGSLVTLPWIISFIEFTFILAGFLVPYYYNYVKIKKRMQIYSLFVQIVSVIIKLNFFFAVFMLILPAIGIIEPIFSFVVSVLLEILEFSGKSKYMKNDEEDIHTDELE